MFTLDVKQQHNSLKLIPSRLNLKIYYHAGSKVTDLEGEWVSQFDLLLKERRGATVDPIEKGGKNKNGYAASPESIPILLYCTKTHISPSFQLAGLFLVWQGDLKEIWLWMSECNLNGTLDTMGPTLQLHLIMSRIWFTANRYKQANK